MEELDVTQLAPRDKHPTIHQRLADLAPGQTLRIYNDHDPRPLKFEIEADFPGVYSWNYVDAGPNVWRVDIGKIPTAPIGTEPLGAAFLDVRPYQHRREEPFDAIMKAVEGLMPGQSLILVNTFEPTPLLRVMEKRGFTHSCTCVAPEEYHVVFSPTA
jgi:uncharacterized protein (DUF2249 family)